MKYKKLFTKKDIEAIARRIDDFIYEYDTYGYRDVGIDREEMVQEIINQLHSSDILCQVCNILDNYDLTEELRFEALREVLQI